MLEITINQDEEVYQGTALIGFGEQLFHDLVSGAAKSHPDHVIIKDLRNGEQQWEFDHPAENENLLAQIGQEQKTSEDNLSTSDEVSNLDHEVQVLAPIKEEEPVKANDSIDIQEESISREEKFEPEIIDFTPDIEDIDEPFSYGDDSEDTIDDFTENEDVVSNIVPVTGTVYLPGERLETVPRSIEKARVKINKKRNTFPLKVLLALLLLLVLLAALANGLFSPAKHYDQVCVDARTSLVTSADECTKQLPNRVIAYVPSSDAVGLHEQSSIPKSSVFEKPSGKVVIKQL